MATVQEFFTPEAVGQITGAVAAVTAVSVTIRKVTGFGSAIIPFVISMVVVYASAGASGTLSAIPWGEFPSQPFFQPLLGWLLPVLNACLLFTAAIGATEVGGAITTPTRLRRLARHRRNENTEYSLREQPINRMNARRKREEEHYLRADQKLFKSWLRQRY